MWVGSLVKADALEAANGGSAGQALGQMRARATVCAASASAIDEGDSVGARRSQSCPDSIAA
jgi:hypothetical protein